MRAFAPRAKLLIVSGGGARNPALVEGLRAALPGTEVALSDAFGVDADAKEAIAFAVLGHTALRGRAAGLPAGHRRARPARAGRHRAARARRAAGPRAGGRSGGLSAP